MQRLHHISHAFLNSLDFQNQRKKFLVYIQVAKSVIKIIDKPAVFFCIFVCFQIAFFVYCISPYTVNQVSYLFSLRGTRNHAVRNKGKIGRITLFIFFGFLSIHILFNEETGDGSNDYDSNNNYGNYDCFLGFFTYFLLLQ